MKKLFRKLFKKEPKFNFAELSKSKIMTERWINPFFSIKAKYNGKTSFEQFVMNVESQKKELLDIISKNLPMPSFIENNPTIMSFPEYDENIKEYTIIIRFIVKKEEDTSHYYFDEQGNAFEEDENARENCLTSEHMLYDKKNKPYVMKGPSGKFFKKVPPEKLYVSKQVEEKDNRKYGFSPITFIQNASLITYIEDIVVNYFQMPPQEQSIQFVFDDDTKGAPFVRESDGILFFDTPIEKRILVHQQHPEIEQYLYGMNGSFLIDWLMEKREANEHMKKYCNKVDEILKRLNVE